MPRLKDRFREEIAPMEIAGGKKGPVVFERDEPPRFVLPRGPELERAPAETRGVPVGVDGTDVSAAASSFGRARSGSRAASQCSATSCGGAPARSRLSASSR